MNGLKVGFGVFLTVVMLFLLGNTVSWTKIEGNEVAVRQHLTQGVVDDVWTSGTHFYMGWFWDVYKYNIGIQKITFDNMKNNKDAEYERIDVEIGANGGQRAYISLSANYRLMPDKIVALHKQGLGRDYENVLLKREIVDTINEIARPYPSALDIYSGAGFVEFKTRVEKALKENQMLQKSGIDIENTIIYGVSLDPAYEAEIAAKQLAMQQKLRKQEETKAAEEEARRIFAMSQANVEKVRQEAEASKIQVITQAEGAAKQAILAAEADKKKVVLEAEGKRDASLAEAAGITARGEAEAKVAQLKRDASYAGESGARKAQVEVAGLQAEKLKGMLQGVSVISDKALYNMGKATGMYTVGVEDRQQQ